MIYAILYATSVSNVLIHEMKHKQDTNYYDDSFL